MQFRTKPINFVAKFEVVGCFCESNGKILLLQRQDYKPQGGKWGLPGGKVDTNETPKKAVLREVIEETGIDASKFPVDFFKTVYESYPDLNFVYHMFHTIFDNSKQVMISPTEHKDFVFVSPKDALKMDLIEDLDICIKDFYRLLKNT